MLSRAVKAYKYVDGKGLDLIEPGVIFMPPHLVKKQTDAGWEADELSICDPHHVDHDSTACKERYPDAYAIPIRA